MTEHKILISKNKIQKKVNELAELVNYSFAGENELIMICVLKGSVMFFTDLAKKIKIPVKYEFIKIKSYGENNTSSGKFHEVLLNTADLNGKNVLVVEDIVDTGNTLIFLNKFFKEKYKMKNYKTISLINKPAKRQQTVDADFYGFEIEDKFIYGYGLDNSECYRNLDYIAFI